MKRPYITQFQRQLTAAGTITGSNIMLGFRFRQLEKEIIKSPIGGLFYKLLHN